MSAQPTTPATTTEHRYLTFRLDEEVYGVPVLDVREIIELQEITPVPQADPSVVGVVNLRGKVLPLVDLKLKFGIGPFSPTDIAVVIVVEPMDTAPFGVLVDEVLDVQSVQPADKTDAPELDSSIQQPFLAGIGKVKDRLVFLLDLGPSDGGIL